MSKIYIGIDNGCTGSIGVIFPDGSSLYLQTPSFLVQDFTKKKQNISRLNREDFKNILIDVLTTNTSGQPDVCFIAVERPFWNPMLSSQSSKGAVMCLESQLGILEDLKLPHEVIDSKPWQKLLLPDGIKGAPALKKASKDIGMRLFPIHADMIRKQKDADGILIAEWARRTGL